MVLNVGGSDLLAICEGRGVNLIPRDYSEPLRPSAQQTKHLVPSRKTYHVAALKKDNKTTVQKLLMCEVRWLSWRQIVILHTNDKSKDFCQDNLLLPRLSNKLPLSDLYNLELC